MTQPSIDPASFLATHPDFINHSASLASLYSSLSSLRSSNPTAYASNVQWWRQTLVDLVWSGAQPSSLSSAVKGKGKEDRLVLHLNEALVDAFTLEDVGRPMGIATVVLDLESSGHLIDLASFLSSTTPFASLSKRLKPPSRSSYIPSARSIASFVLGKPVTYALGALGLSASEDEDEDEITEWKRAEGDWVCWQNVEAAGNVVLSSHYASAAGVSPLDSLFTDASFKDMIRSALPYLISEDDARVVIKYLVRDRRLAVARDGVIKLARSEAEVNAVEPITEDDKGLLAVKETHAKLEKQIEQIEQRVREREAAVTKAIRTKQSQTVVLHLLRSKRELTSLLERRLASKVQLDSILLRIEQSAGDTEVLRAYEASTSILRNLNAKSCGVERVEEVMQNLEDVMADQAEVDSAMREGNEAVRMTQGSVPDLEDEEAALEEEMARLEEEERCEQQEREEKRKLEEQEMEVKELQRERERQEAEERRQRQLQQPELSNEAGRQSERRERVGAAKETEAMQTSRREPEFTVAVDD